MRRSAAARLRSERQAGGYRCAAEGEGPGHRTQWADPATGAPLPMLPVRSQPPASAPLTTALHRLFPPPGPAHLPSPTLSRPPILLVAAALPDTGPWLPCVAHATPLSTNLPLYARELRSGREPPLPGFSEWLGVGAWLAGGFLSCRSPPRWSPGFVGVTGMERPSWRYPTPRNAHAAAAGLRTPSRRSAHVCAGEKAGALRRKAGTHPVPRGAPQVHRFRGAGHLTGYHAVLLAIRPSTFRSRVGELRCAALS